MAHNKVRRVPVNRKQTRHIRAVMEVERIAKIQ